MEPVPPKGEFDRIFICWERLTVVRARGPEPWSSHEGIYLAQMMMNLRTIRIVTMFYRYNIIINESRAEFSDTFLVVCDMSGKLFSKRSDYINYYLSINPS